MTNTTAFDSSLRTVTSLIEQIHTWPVSVVLFATLIILGSALQKAEFFPDRTIPLVMLACGVLLNILIGDPSQVSPSQRYPAVIFGMWGFMIGFMSWMAHMTILKRFKKFVPMPLLNGGSGSHTTIVERTETTTVIDKKGKHRDQTETTDSP